MKIYVVSRQYVESCLKENENWYKNKWIISIYSSESFSPLPDQYNILKLQFDDVSEKDIGGWSNIPDTCIFFDEEHAKAIHSFIDKIRSDSEKEFYIHCDAGISRSGAVGTLLNEYFNKFLGIHRMDNESFIMNNSHIMPNPLVVRVLKKELFGSPFC